jgi:DNA mismatch repair protein MutS2
MPLYGAVLTEMGDDQSIEHSLSTFTAHLGHLLRFLEAAEPSTLVLLDEIAVGTDPGEGAALAQSLLEALAATGAHVMVTTHYERLKGLPVEDERFVNASVGFDLEQMSPTYQLHIGLPGSSGALAVARRVGLPAHLAQRAEAVLDRGGEQLAKLLTSLAGDRTRLAEQQQELARATTEAERLADRHRTELERLKQREQQAFQLALSQAIDELKRARQDLERVRALLRRPPSKERLAQADRQISQAAGRILPHEPRRTLEGRPATPELLAPGTRVLVPRLGGEGEVVEAPSRGRVMVRVGGLRTGVAVEDVLLPPDDAPRARRAAAPGPVTETPRAPRAPSDARPLRTPANTVDLRGMRVDEALAEADRALDRALQAGEEVLFLIHGHGTGALRSALRGELPGHPLVERIHPADTADGGDGVTVVWLK